MGLNKPPRPMTIKYQGNAVGLQFAQDKVFAEPELVGDLRESGKFLHRMAQGTCQARRLVLEDGQLGGGGAGIDGKYLHFSD